MERGNLGREQAAIRSKVWDAEPAGRASSLVLWSALGLAAQGDGRGGSGGVLERLFSLDPKEFLRRIPGRESFTLPAAGVPAIVVKRYRGEERSDWWFQRWSGLPLRSQARRECENLAELAALGIPVPRPVAWFEEARALDFPWRDRATRERGGRSASVMEFVPHREDLRAWLAKRNETERRRMLRPLAELVARLHHARWYHRDLYLQHFVVASDPPEGGTRLVLIDVGRARHEHPVRRRWLVKDLAALYYSRPSHVDPRHCLRFLVLYFRLSGVVERGAKRSFASAVIAKARRIASHEPKYTDLRSRSGTPQAT